MENVIKLAFSKCTATYLTKRKGASSLPFKLQHGIPKNLENTGNATKPKSLRRLEFFCSEISESAERYVQNI